MGIVRFASICDQCGKRGQEYQVFLHCRECGRDLCPEHKDADYDDEENCLTLCAVDTGCQRERNEWGDL
jgi:hypothetical protein